MLPALTPRIEFQNLTEFLAHFEGLPPISGGVASFGAPAAYALVWEFGSSRMHKPGPKTMWSTNPLGERAILTRQAPFGYIHIHSGEFWPILREEFARVDFSQATTARELELRLEIALDNANQRLARLMSDSAPVDTGDLRASIQLVDSKVERNFDEVGWVTADQGFGTFFL